MFKIKEVINGNEAIVEPNWFWEGYSGNKIFLEGYLTPLKEGDFGYSFAKKKLKFLLTNLQESDTIELYSPKFWEAYGKETLVVSLYKNDVPLKRYFPEFSN